MTPREKDIADATVRVLGDRSHWRRVGTVLLLFGSGLAFWALVIVVLSWL